MPDAPSPGFAEPSIELADIHKPETPFERLIDAFQKAELLAANWHPSEYVKRTDDGKNEIQTKIDLRVGTSAQLAQAVKIAESHGFGAMSIGAQTSAIGAFKANKLAPLHGWMGLELSQNGSRPSELLGTDESQDGKIIERDGSCYKVHERLNGRLQILENQDSQKPHRILAWGSVFPKDVDEALEEVLGKGHSIYLDLTTRDQAQLAAVVATGAQGPTRANARNNLKRLVVTDGKGELHQLEAEEAEMQVGLGGLAGAISEIELEVVKEMPEEFGVFVPLPGDLSEGIQEKFPQVMALLSKYARYKKDESGTLVSDTGKDFLFKGFEIVSRPVLSQITGESDDRDTRSKAGGMLNFMDESHQVGLLINGRTTLDKQQIQQEIIELFYNEIGGEDGEEVENPLLDLVGEVVAFDDREMNDVRKVREATASTPRESVNEGPTKSTDFNIRINTQDPHEIELAYAEVWKVYYKYLHYFQELGAKVFLYGHNHPGTAQKGGGIDAHIRVTFSLDSVEAFENAPKNLLKLAKKQKELYSDLIALNGQHGIKIAAGEKGELLNPQYLRWLEENKPEHLQKICEYIQKYGGKTFGLRDERFKVHAYPPRLKNGLLNHLTPDFSVDSEGVLDQYQKAILLWCQNHPDSLEGKQVVGEIYGLIRDWLNLDFNDRVFFTHSIESGLQSSIQGLTDFQNGGEVIDLRIKPSPDSYFLENKTIITSDPQDLNDEKFEACQKILVVDGSDPLKKEVIDQADAVIYSGQALGAGSELGMIITNNESIKRARHLKKEGNTVGGAESLITLNDKPHQVSDTLQKQALLELGCVLAAWKQGAAYWEPSDAQEKLRAAGQKLILDPRCPQIHPVLLAEAMQINQMASDLRGNPDRISEITEEAKEAFAQFMDIPDGYQVIFGAGDLSEKIRQAQDEAEHLKVIQMNHGMADMERPGALDGVGVCHGSLAQFGLPHGFEVAIVSGNLASALPQADAGILRGVLQLKRVLEAGVGEEASRSARDLTEKTRTKVDQITQAIEANASLQTFPIAETGPSVINFRGQLPPAVRDSIGKTLGKPNGPYDKLKKFPSKHKDTLLAAGLIEGPAHAMDVSRLTHNKVLELVDLISS